MTVGRNDPCPCGSGLRFKKCCGKLDGDVAISPFPSPPPVAATMAAGMPAAGFITPTTPPGVLPSAPPGSAAMMTPPPGREDTGAMLKRGVARHQSGDLAGAASIYQQVLQREPAHADALHLSGLVAHALGDIQRAIDLIHQAISARPGTATFHSNLGNMLQERGELQAACEQFQQALRIKPDFAPPAYNLANCCLQLDQPDDAIRWYQQALAIQPQFIEAMVGIGNAMLNKGQAADAASWFERAIAADPESAAAAVGLGQAQQDLGQLEAACEQYRRALVLAPHNLSAYLHLGQCQLQMGQGAHAVVAFEAAVRAGYNSADAHYGLGNAYFEVGELEQAIASYKQALALKPEYAEAHYNLGNVYRAQDRTRDAMQCYEQAVKIRPDFFAARWAECMAQIPVVYKRFEEIAVARTRYREGLERLERKLGLDSPAAIDAAVTAVASMQPFYLAYQCQNDRELQMLYGRLMTSIMHAKYPQWSTPIPKRPVAGRRVKVGLVSAFFFSHSNWKLPIKGWIEQLDPQQFELYGYYTGRQAMKDEQTDVARRHCTRFVEDAASIEQLATTIRADDLDVLIYPEIGMSPLSASLAALYLAPVQCNSWGHPQTSGLPAIDYFLSSDLMEPQDAQAHYSEKLVRLPNLSVYIDLQERPRTSFVRDGFGLAEDRPLFFCAQSLFKYLPQYDHVFPAIAEKVGACQFAFIDYPQSKELTQRFVDRIANEFRRKGMKAEDYVVMLPHLDALDYQAMNQLADVFLDSIGWNGCNSSLEALNCNLPVVTMPGQLMRGLHTQAMLKMIGVDETIAHDIDSYIDIAAKLGSNPALRRTIAGKIADNKHRLARDRTTIDGLQQFLLQVTQ